MRTSAMVAALATWLAASGAAAQPPLPALTATAHPDSEYRFELGYPLERVPNGALNLATVARLGLRGVDALATLWTPRCAGIPALCAVARFLEAGLVGLPVASSAIVFSHEGFGHAARARELGVAPQVRFAAPLPYVYLIPGADPRTDNRVNVPERSPAFTADERALIDLGGYQAQEFLSRHVAFTAFRAGALRQGEALLYHFITLHLGGTIAAGGADFSAHLRHLGARYGGRRAVDLPADAATYGAATALDPLFWFALYTAYYQYIVRGNRSVAYPALDLGRGARLSMTSRVLFVPWGREHQLDVLIGTPLFNLDVTLRTGFGPGSASVGLSVAAMDLRPLPWLHLGASLDLWAQPALAVVGGTAPRDRLETNWGAGGWLLAEVRAGVGFVGLRAGGKTAGLVVEQPYAAGFEAVLTGGVRLGD